MRSVVVVGGVGPNEKVTNLGVNLRDELNNALARQATGIDVQHGGIACNGEAEPRFECHDL